MLEEYFQGLEIVWYQKAKPVSVHYILDANFFIVQFLSTYMDGHYSEFIDSELLEEVSNS